MPFLLRVLLPDVPGSLGRVATAIGMAGGDIEAIEIVEKRSDGTAVDDVLLELEQGMMPDSVVSACNALDDVEVLFVSRYPAGGNLMMDLEAVEELTAASGDFDKLIDLLPATFRVDWAARVHRAKGVVYGTSAAPDELDFVEIEAPLRLEAPEDEVTLFAAARLDGNEIVIVGRRGGPEFAESEIARLGHLCGLAVTIATA
ncbi:amino acid-binding protein [Pimelobacter simplex]|uniref:amino acid-binding protein n=1 Tax=Nocardioides simplex TaxID=2045 RepID=UPI0021504A9F|nr:amino acid-binding protein [Pimelobacter simplex]UUW91571.1 amino acid-binding protein [Pimelobacter simplex]UUW95399.1 amino acid-binding protein [Pimelobacter simplex]